MAAPSKRAMSRRSRRSGAFNPDPQDSGPLPSQPKPRRCRQFGHRDRYWRPGEPAAHRAGIDSEDAAPPGALPPSIGESIGEGRGVALMAILRGNNGSVLRIFGGRVHRHSDCNSHNPADRDIMAYSNRP
jgi:hypothetical protein